MEAFRQIFDTLRVIARAGPEDKLLITEGLQNMHLDTKSTDEKDV